MGISRGLGAAGILLALLLLTGCGGDPAATPDSSSSSSPDPSGGESSPAEGDRSSAPTVEPASGEPLVTDTAFVRVPPRWRVEEFGFGILNAISRRDEGVITLVDLGTVASRNPRELTRTGLRNFEGKPEVEFDAELAGTPAYRATGRDTFRLLEEYGAVRGGKGVVLAFSLDRSLSASQRRQIIDSVLASFAWN